MGRIKKYRRPKDVAPPPHNKRPHKEHPDRDVFIVYVGQPKQGSPHHMVSILTFDEGVDRRRRAIKYAKRVARELRKNVFVVHNRRRRVVAIAKSPRK
jgi:hypothetical protein